MSFHNENRVNSLCQKALHIVYELCFAGQVESEKCSGILPPDRGSQGGGSTGNRGRARSRPRAPLRAPGPVLPRRAGGIFRTQRLPTLLLPPTWECGLFLCCLPISTRPAPSTSQVRSWPAVWLPGFCAPSPRTPTPRVSLPERSG